MTRSARVYQLGCVAVALAVLAAVAAPAQRQLVARRTAAENADIAPGQNSPTLAAKTQGLDSFSMGLLLGGFRGPLVMYLWVTSEEDKNNEETEQFLTDAKLIGDLQPQFAAIYIHQSWNLAYNVSVQYNRESEKYRWVMEGVRFAERGNERLPHNVDILSQLGQIYFDKLGDSFESPFYRTQFRKDSLTPTVDPDRPTLKVDQNFRLLPQYSQQWPYIDHLDGILAVINRNNQAGSKSPMPPRPPDLAEYRALGLDEQTSRHQWKHGVSVFAISYDYRKQATLYGRHAQFSPSVVSGQPSLALRAWLKEELNLALDEESKLWPMGQLNQPLPVPAVGKIAPDDPALADALDYYQEAQRVAQLARAEYLSHLAAYPGDWDIYTTHLNDVTIKSRIAEAGERRLTGIIAWLTAKKSGDQDALALAGEKLRDARLSYLNAVPLIHDYLETEYRYDQYGREENAEGRKPFEKLADQAERAADQIDRMLR